MAKVTRTCKYCGKEFFAYKRLVNMGEAKYCSRICATTASRGKKVYACSDETKKRMSESRKKYLKENPQTGEKHWNWQGGKNKCVDCGKRLSNWYGKRCGPCAAFHRIKIRDPRVKIVGYVTIICDYCGNEHQQKRNNYSPDAKHRFCSKKCEGLWRRINGARGKDHWNYKHGNKSLHLKIRTLPQYREWRTKVFERDGYVCRLCGKHDETIVVHHIQFFAEIMKRYKIKSLLAAERCKALWNVNNGITLCGECHKESHIQNKILKEHVIAV